MQACLDTSLSDSIVLSLELGRFGTAASLNRQVAAFW